MSNYPPEPTPTGGQESWNPPPQPAPPAVGAAMQPTAGTLLFSQADKDASDLKTLSIFWYIIAGLQALGACIFLLYILIGVLFAVIGGAAGASSNDPGAAAVGVGFGAFFACIFLIPLTFVLTIAFLNYKVGKSLNARKNLTLIYIMAALACLFFPLGTALGVFTFIVLNRPSIKASFT